MGGVMERSVNKLADARATHTQIEDWRSAIRKNPEYLVGYRTEKPRSASMNSKGSRGFLARLGLGGVWRRADSTADTVSTGDNSDHAIKIVSASDIRAWVVKGASMPRPKLNSTELSFGNQSSSIASDDENIKAADGVEEKINLKIANVRIDGPLKLDGIIAPNVSIAIEDVEVDDIFLDGSQFAKLSISNVRSRDWPGIYLTCEYATFEAIKLDATAKGCGDILHFGARGLKASELEIFRHRFMGGDFFNYLERTQGEGAAQPLKRFCLRSLDASNSQIGDVAIYRCAFSSLVTFRDAVIRNMLKFEACVFAGLNPLNEPPKANSENDLFDYDDIRDGIADLRGLVLDLSRSKLGMLSIQDLLERGSGDGTAKSRLIKFPGQDTELPSSGWMNFAHARAKVLGMDFAYYSTDHGHAPLRHRLAWFEYDELHILHVGKVPVSATAEESKKGEYKKTGDKGKNKGIKQGYNSGSQAEQWQQVLNWLNRQLEGDLTIKFQAQPWTTAAKVFHASGDFYQANIILRERERLAHRSLWYKGHIWRWLVESPNIVHGFGYVLWRPFALMLALWIAGGLFYQHSFNAGYFLPNPATGGIEQMSADPKKSWTRQYPDTKYPKFNEWIYSLDVMIPVVHFSQEAYWVPGYGTREAEQRDALAADEESRSLWQRVTSGREGDGDGLLRLWIFYWTQIILGYVGTIVIGLGLVGYLERRPPA
jgi:hypothetical protein